LDNIHTPLYNPKDKHDANKINHLISQNFEQKAVSITDELEPFVTKARLVDMLDFSVVDFNKAISLTPKISFTIDTKFPLEAIGNLVSINESSINPQDQPNKKFVYVDIDSLNNETSEIDFSNYIFGKDAPSRARRLANKGSVVISTVRPYLKGFTFISHLPEHTVFSTGFAIIETLDSKKLMNKYLFELFKTSDFLMQQILNAMPKASYPSINVSDIRNFKIPLPPLKIQEQIINDCQKIDDEVEEAKETIVAFANNINALISESNNYTNSQNTKIGSVLDLKAGKFVSASDIANDYHQSLYPCYGGNGLRGYTKTFTHEGDYSLIGRQGALCGNITRVSGKFHATEHAIVVTPLIDMNDTWLYYKLVSLDLNQYATGVAQPGLSVKNLNNIPIKIIPIEEQNKIAKEIQALESKLDEAQAIIDASVDKKHAIIESYL